MDLGDFMLNIFILEDDFIQQSRLEKAILSCVEETSVKYKSLEIFGKPNQLLDAIQETGNHQFFFLDIEIKGEERKGMEIAREIRERDPYAIIVFVTTHSEFMPVTYRYRVSALDFIDKGLSNTEFQKAVNDVLVHAFENIDHTVAENSFVYKTENAHVQVPLSDILYFETSTTMHKVILKTKTGQQEFYGKVSEIAKADDRLYHAHRAYVVNPANIIKIDRTNHIIYFENGDSCLISRLKQKQLVDMLEIK